MGVRGFETRANYQVDGSTPLFPAMKINKRISEEIRIDIPTLDYLNRTDSFQEIHQWAFDNGWGNLRVLPDKIIWPGNALWKPDETVTLIYSRSVGEELLDVEI